MKKRYLTVGGVAGAASVAARLRRLDEEADIMMFERGEHVSFSNCSLPYYLSGDVQDAMDLVLMDPELFMTRYRIDARTKHEVLSIDRENKSIRVKNLVTGEEKDEKYDVLFLSPGARPIMPQSIQGIHMPHVFSVRDVQDITRLKSYIDTHNVQDIAVVGGGFIGIEVMESLHKAGKNVSVVEMANQVMMPFDEDMAQLLHKEIIDNGVHLILKDGIQSIQQDHITLASGRVVKAQAVVMSIGVAPETQLAKEAGLQIGVSGGIQVNHHYQTSDPNIYALGDAIEVSHFVTGKPTRLTLAGPAQRQARDAADHVMGREVRNTGVIGSSVVRCFNLNAASTGLNEKQLQKEGMPYEVAFVVAYDKVSIIPDANPVFFKLIYAYPSGKLLGAQAIGKGNVDKRIDVVAALIKMNGTLEDLKDMELCYSPLFGTAKDVVNHAALSGLNLLNGEYKQVLMTQVRPLWEQGAYFVDAREGYEFEGGHIKGAVNIPLSEFRHRLDEIPKDKDVYIYCRSGQRSYNMVRALEHLGFNRVYNVAGSMLATSLHEYYWDSVLNREPIVTDYVFP